MKYRFLIIFFFCICYFDIHAQTPSPKMVKVEGGSFSMGDTTANHSENQQHIVQLRTFYLAETETTVAQWKVYCKEANEKMPQMPNWGWQDHHPIVGVSFNDVGRYIEWLNEKTGKKFRLPTEAEWEYAAKGGAKRSSALFSGDNHPENIAWFADNSQSKTHEVATKTNNALGIFDMTGNAAEWCQDRYGVYPTKATANPKGPQDGFFRIVRGGSWYNRLDFCKNTYRAKYVATARFDYIGFRLAADQD